MQRLSQINSSHKAATAHLVLKCKAGEEDHVLEQLRKIEGVREIQRTIGEFDILAKVESDDSDTLRRMIRWKVMRNDKVLSVITLMCMRKALCTVQEEIPLPSKI